MTYYFDDNLFETYKDCFFFYFDKCILQILYYYRTELTNRIDSAKKNNSTICIVCHYWFFNRWFKLQNSIYNRCHDLTMLCVNNSGIDFIIIKRIDYRRIIHNISKSESIWLLENAVLNDSEYM